jgi:hypothetical protein
VSIIFYPERYLTTEGTEVKFNKKLCELSVFCNKVEFPLKRIRCGREKMVIKITYALKKLRGHRGRGNKTSFKLLISNIFSAAPPLES